MTKRQATQSIGQFLIIFFSGLAIYKAPPASLEEFWLWAWQPLIQGVITALGVWGVSKIGPKA